jgi:hypothetical protein
VAGDQPWTLLLGQIYHQFMLPSALLLILSPHASYPDSDQHP